MFLKGYQSVSKVFFPLIYPMFRNFSQASIYVCLYISLYLLEKVKILFYMVIDQNIWVKSTQL